MRGPPEPASRVPPATLKMAARPPPHHTHTPPSRCPSHSQRAVRAPRRSPPGCPARRPSLRRCSKMADTMRGSRLAAA